MDNKLIRVRDLSIGFQDQVALKEVSFDVPQRGVVALMGPAGVGKSTLLRTLGRWNELRPAFWCHGTIELGGADLLQLPADHVRRRVALLSQKARLYTSSVLDNAIAEVRGERRLDRRQKLELARSVLERHDLWGELAPRLDWPVVKLSIARQRMLSIARLVSGGAECLLVDEPLRDIDPEERDKLQSFLAALGQQMAVVLVTHDQQEAQLLSDYVCLFSGHRLVEAAPTSAFFANPATELGQTFVKLGSCWPDSPSSPPPAGRTPSWVPTPQEAVYRPGGFHWVLRDRLGGMQRPGLLGDLSADLAGLQQMSIRALVTLTEEPFDEALLLAYRISAVHFPIVDMDVPEPAEAEDLCRRLSAMIDRGERVVLHCKAGLGRTGTMLACVLVYRGESAVRAVDRVRSVNPLYIQSDVQLRFVGEFETYRGRA